MVVKWSSTAKNYNKIQKYKKPTIPYRLWVFWHLLIQIIR